MINLKIKENKNRLFLILLILLLISGCFYWFQIRPSQIKHDCSWIKHTNEAIPAKPAMNEEELRQKSVLKDCSLLKSLSAEGNPYAKIGLDSCEQENRRTIEEYKIARPAIPAKDWWVQADKDEYSFCLHDKGL